MAISGVSGSTSSYRDTWESSGGIYGNDEVDESGSSSGATQVWNAVFTDKKDMGVTAEDFLKLMVTQLTNQDFMNPVDDSQYVTQMAQITTMQQMTELANYSKTSYVMSLVGKNVTAARITVSGELQKETGPVTKISLTNNEFGIYVNGKKFSLEQLMEIHSGAAASDDSGSDFDTATTDQNKKSYLLSLVGRDVTITKKGDDSDDTLSFNITGTVERVSSADGKYRVYVNGNWHELDEVTEVAGSVKDEDSTATTPTTGEADE